MVQAADGGLSVKAGGVQVFELAPPSLADSSHTIAGESPDATLRAVPAAGGGWTVTLAADPAWLAAAGRVWPVVIDPTVTLGATDTQGCNTTSDNPTTNFCNQATYYIGHGTGGGAGRGMFQFNDVTTAVPRDAVVTDALFALYENSPSSTMNATNLEVHGLTQAWTTGATWNTSDGTTAWPTSGPSGTTDGPGGDYNTISDWTSTNAQTTSAEWLYFHPDALVQNWVHGTVDNDGLLLKATSETVNNFMTISSWEDASSALWPSLLVNYTQSINQNAAYSAQLDNGLGVSVDATSGNLSVSAEDLHLAGTGLALNAAHYYNSASSPGAGELGYGWTTSLEGPALDIVNGASATVGMPDGQNYPFYAPAGGTGSATCGTGTFVEPPGVNASLCVESDGVTYDLTFNKTQEVWKFKARSTGANSATGYRTADTDRNGNTIAYTYDLANILSDGLPALDSVTDTRGRVLTVSNPTGPITGYSDTGRTIGFTTTAGNTTSITDATGQATTYGYTGALLTEITTPDGRITTIAYNGADQVASITRVTNNTTLAGLTTQFTYTAFAPDDDGIQATTTVTDPRSNATVYTYSTFDNVASVQDANGHSEATDYTENNDPTTLTNALTQTSTLNYDVNNNLTQATEPASVTGSSTPVSTYLSYATAGGDKGATWLPSSQLDGEGNCSSYNYDSSGNQTASYTGLAPTGSSHNCDGVTTGATATSASAAYQGDGTTACGAKTGELCATTNQNGNSTSYGYDSTGQVTSMAPGVSYTPVTPARIETNESITASGTVGVQVTGVGGVPAGASAVVFQLIVPAPTVTGSLWVYPTGVTPQPTSTAVNFASGEPAIGNEITARLNAAGNLTIFDNAGAAVAVDVDIDGYYRTGGKLYTPVTDDRLADTRTGSGLQDASSTLGAAGSINVQVSGASGDTVIPTAATAAVLDISTIGPSANSAIMVYGAGTTRPSIGQLYAATGVNATREVVVPLSSSGAITVYNTTGSVDIVVDVEGYFAPSGATHEPVLPSRIRATTGTGIAAGGTLNVQVSGQGGVPTTGVSAVVVDVIAVAPTATAALAVYPTGGATAPTDLNAITGATIDNEVTVALGTSGQITILNSSTGTTNIIVGVQGYFTTNQTVYTYDTNSRVATTTDPKGQTTSYTYDADDRVTQILYNGTSTCTYTAGTCLGLGYDTDGNLTTRHDSSGLTTLVYDPLNRLTNQQLPAGANACAGSSPAAIVYTYDPASNLATYCDAAGPVSYAYDPANRMVGVATGTGSCTPGSIIQPCSVYAYDNANELLTVTYPTTTGVVETYTYNHAGNVLTAAVTGGTATAGTYTYTYKQGTIDKPLAQTMVRSATAITTTYSYNPQNELAGAAGTGTGATSQAYTYDPDGNLATETLAGTAHTLTYNNADQLCWAYVGTSTAACGNAPSGAVTYNYDTDGNQTASSAGEANTYNPVNQTASMTTPTGGTPITMAYTGIDSTQRTTAGPTTLTNSQLGVASTTTTGATTTFTRDPSGRLNSMVAGGSRYYYLYDGSGNIIGLITTAGAQVATYTYDPYGTTTTSGTEAAANPFRYEAGYQDTTSYIKFGTRYYNPTLAAWTQTDPSQQNPGYLYAGDNPTNETDPTGLCGIFSCITDAANEVGSAFGGLSGGFEGVEVGEFAGALIGSLIGPEGTVIGGELGGAIGEGIGFELGYSTQEHFDGS